MIKNITICADAHVDCRSSFYASSSSLNGFGLGDAVTLLPGLNCFVGEIDSSGWALSYLLSMYSKRSKNITLYDVKSTINDKNVTLDQLTNLSCYIDTSYPLFSHQTSVRKMITNGLRKSGLAYSTKDIKSIFQLDDQRFERAIHANGNERYRAMPAIAFCHRKEIYCFPWMSKNRFDYFKYQIMYSVKLLSELGKIIILPVGVGSDISMPNFSDFHNK